MHCSKCGNDNREGRKFCAKCGASLSRPCPHCNASNQPGEDFCGECGTALVEAAPVLAPKASTSKPILPGIRVNTEQPDASPALEGERKTVTALFADIKGSMDLMEDLDPEEARAIVDPALKLMIDAVHRYDGYIVQSTGDGIFALFGAPVAHEDHPQRALHAALRMQDEMRRYSTKLREAGNPPIEARVGINTGEAVVRSIKTGDAHTEYTPIGHSTSLAARMQTLAPTGSIAVTEATQKLCAGYFNFKALGPTRVKGVSEPVNVYEVTGLGPLRTRLQRSAGRGLTKFVGRSREIDAMKHAAEQATAGHGQIVAAMAEAGVGKSRLFHEFKAVSPSGWMVLEAFSVSHGKASAFLPVIDLLWSYFKITSEDDERTRREKVTGRMLALDRSLEDALPYLYSLLGLSDENSQVAEIEAQTRKRRALDAIKRILLRESLNQPLIVIFEDLHWVDSESQAFLNLLADSIATARILMLVNYRPEYRHEWGHKSYYTQLRLDPLGRESADEMLQALLGDAAELAPLKRLIIEKTEGNPLFMEETFEVLLEEGALVRNGSIKLVKPLRELKIPPTVQDILAARIDRLPMQQKDLLQTLAVIGTEFRLDLVRRLVAHSEDELERMLEALQLSEFIFEQPASGDIEYIFKHALTHDVAYKSVLSERRRMLHERTGAGLESIYAESLNDHVAELAYHYARSGNARKAAEYCLSACRQCGERAAYFEAVRHLDSGLAALQQLPDDDRRAELELDLRIASLTALTTTSGYGSLEGERSAARALELCRRPGTNWEKLWLTLAGSFRPAIVRPDIRRALDIGAEMLALAEPQESAEHIAQSVGTIGFANLAAGSFVLADRDFARTVDLYESIRTSTTRARRHLLDDATMTPATANALWSWTLWFLGHPDRSLDRMVIATELAHESGSKTNLEAVHNYAGTLYHWRREFEPTRERFEATVALSTELGNMFRRSRSQIYLGWADAMSGDLAGGLALMRQSLSDYEATNAQNGSDYYLALIATVLGRMGHFEAALGTIEEAFTIVERSGAAWNLAEVHRLKGELLLAQDASNAAPAEQCFRTAIEISRQQHAKSWELRATVSLARLLAKQGRRNDARAMLGEIYNWFTEGVDTADLKDAKALLEELGPA
jgi:class 3 adenylate cyclase